MKGYLYWSAYNNICETLHMDAAPGRLLNGDATACGNSLAMASRDGKATPELFMLAARQFLATADAKTCAVSCDDFEEYDLGFEVRRHGDFLYVTRADADDRLAPGMRIAAVGKNAIPFLLKDTGTEIFWGRGTDRENWDLVMRMYDDVDVFPGDGHVERLGLRRFPPEGAGAGEPCARVSEVASGTALVQLSSLADSAALGEALAGAAGTLESAPRLVVDLRHCAGDADPASYLALLPYLVGAPTPAREVFSDTQVYTIYSKANVERLLAPLEAARAKLEAAGDGEHAAFVDEVAADIRAKGERVLEAKRAVTGLAERRRASELPETLPSPFTDEVVRPAPGGARRTAVLVDSTTGAGAEAFAQAVMGFGNVVLAGRATPGAVDYANYATAEYPDISARLVYPISRTAANRDGRGSARDGLPLDVHVPFAPEECARDLILERAVEALG